MSRQRKVSASTSAESIPLLSPAKTFQTSKDIEEGGKNAILDDTKDIQNDTRKDHRQQSATNWLVIRLNRSIRGLEKNTFEIKLTCCGKIYLDTNIWNQHGIRYDKKSNRWYLKLSTLDVKEIRAKVWQVQLE